MMLNFLVGVSKSMTYTCGSGNVEFGGIIPVVTSTLIIIIEVFVPVGLVLFGMFDLGKAVIAQKEDEIKKGQATFIKRLFAAVLVFFVIFIVKLVVGFVADDSDGTIANCFECFTKGTESQSSCMVKGGNSSDGGIGQGR